MYLSLHWHGAEGLYTVKKLNYASLRLKKEGITILKLYASLFEYLQQGINCL